MNRFIIVFFILSLFLVISIQAYGEDDELIKSLEKINSVLIEKDTEFKITMEIVRGRKKNKFALTLWTSNRNFVTRTEKPISQKGQMFLYSNGNCWIYYPEIDKTIKTSQNQRLLGGDFSFIDLAILDLHNDYNSGFIKFDPADIAKLADEQKTEIMKVVETGKVIQSIVIEGKNVSYPKVLIILDKDGLPYAMLFYTLSGQLLGIMTYSEYKDLDGKFKPTQWTMRTSLNLKNYSVIEYREAEYNMDIPQVYFTETKLKSLSRGDK